jgi:hypothetical protein
VPDWQALCYKKASFYCHSLSSTVLTIMKLTALTLLAMPVLLLAQNNFCQGEYDPTKAGTCDAFQFENVVPDQQQCGTDKKPQKVEGGVQQTNCTTFYDISSLPSQKIDAHTIRMAQLITNV